MPQINQNQSNSSYAKAAEGRHPKGQGQQSGIFNRHLKPWQWVMALVVVGTVAGGLMLAVVKNFTALEIFGPSGTQGPEQIVKVTEGKNILEGYLVTDCPWQAIPWLENVKSSYGDSCSLDIWFSKNKPPERGMPDICRHVNHTGEPITSKCFFEKIGLDILDWGEYPQVTLIGKYEKMKVCIIGCKGPGPECGERCKEEKVFVPNKVIKK